MEELDKIDARKNDEILELSIEALKEFDEDEEWFLSPAVVNTSKPPPSKKTKDQPHHSKQTQRHGTLHQTTDQNTTQLPKAHPHNKHHKITPTNSLQHYAHQSTSKQQNKSTQHNTTHHSIYHSPLIRTLEPLIQQQVNEFAAKIIFNKHCTK